MPTVVLKLLGRLPVLCLLAGIAGAALAESVTLERDSVLRAEPRADSAAVTNLARGATGEAVARQGAWVQIKSGAATGWLYSFNVRFGAVEGAALHAFPERLRPCHKKYPVGEGLLTPLNQIAYRPARRGIRTIL